MSLMASFRDPAVGTFIGLLGIALAFYFYVKSVRKKKLVFANKESVVLGDSDDSFDGRLRVLFDQKEVTRVTRSVFVLWNAGRETIRGSDIAHSDPLCLTFPEDTEILMLSVDRMTRSAVAANVKPRTEAQRHCVCIDFDFLDFKDGFTLSVVHNAPTGVGKIAGTIVGMPDGVQNAFPSDRDIEAYRTPRKEGRRVVRFFVRAWNLVVKSLLLLVPPVIVVFSIFTAIPLALFPSLGKPDMSAMLIAGQVNYLWLVAGIFFLLIEIAYLASVFSRPPRGLTG